MPCIIAECTNYPEHNIGIRLRRPDGTAIWAPNTNAYVCDQHAAHGFRIEITLTLTRTRRIETIVDSPGGETFRRVTPTNQEP